MCRRYLLHIGGTRCSNAHTRRFRTWPIPVGPRNRRQLQQERNRLAGSVRQQPHTPIRHGGVGLERDNRTGATRIAGKRDSLFYLYLLPSSLFTLRIVAAYYRRWPASHPHGRVLSELRELYLHWWCSRLGQLLRD